jgi:hypothetical protein
MEPLKITLGRTSWPVTLPEFAIREELVVAWGACPDDDFMRLRRVAAAAVCLSTQIGKRARLDYGKHRCDVVVYGGAAWGFLHEQGETLQEVVTAGAQIVSAIALELAPRASEVADRSGFSEAPADGSTPT